MGKRDPGREGLRESRTSPGRTVVLGVGNAWRRDDGAGPAVTRRLRVQLGDGEPACRSPEAEGLVVRELEGEATELMAAWEGAGTVLVIDAVQVGAGDGAPGRVCRFDAVASPLPAIFSPAASSHGLGLAEAVELSRRLGTLPPRLVVYGIEGEDFGPGEGLTPAVAAAVERVAEEVRGEVD